MCSLIVLQRLLDKQSRRVEYTCRLCPIPLVEWAYTRYRFLYATAHNTVAVFDMQRAARIPLRCSSCNAPLRALRGQTNNVGDARYFVTATRPKASGAALAYDEDEARGSNGLAWQVRAAASRLSDAIDFRLSHNRQGNESNAVASAHSSPIPQGSSSHTSSVVAQTARRDIVVPKVWLGCCTPVKSVPS